LLDTAALLTFSGGVLSAKLSLKNLAKCLEGEINTLEKQLRYRYDLPLYHFLFQLAKEHGMFFSETSAKDNLNVDESFMEILNKIVDKVSQIW